MTPQRDDIDSWGTDDVWAAIRAVLDNPDIHDAIEARVEFEERYLTPNGQLLLTPNQVTILRRELLDRDFLSGPPPLFVPRPRWSDVPVLELREGVPVAIGDGKKAILLADRIFTYRETDLTEKITPGSLRITPDDRYPMLDQPKGFRWFG